MLFGLTRAGKTPEEGAEVENVGFANDEQLGSGLSWMIISGPDGVEDLKSEHGGAVLAVVLSCGLHLCVAIIVFLFNPLAHLQVLADIPEQNVVEVDLTTLVLGSRSAGSAPVRSSFVPAPALQGIKKKTPAAHRETPVGHLLTEKVQTVEQAENHEFSDVPSIQEDAGPVTDDKILTAGSPDVSADSGASGASVATGSPYGIIGQAAEGTAGYGDSFSGDSKSPPGVSGTITPRYPRSSRVKGEEGDVTLWFRVLENGRVEDIRVVKSSGFDGLDMAAEKAVMSHHFIPAQRNKQRLASACTLTITFRLKT